MESDNDSVSSSGSDVSSREDYESESISESISNSEDEEDDMDVEIEGDDIDVKFYIDLQLAKDNNPNVTELHVRGNNEYIQNFTDEDWVEFGRALSKNTHLEHLQFFVGALNDHKMSLLFRGLGLTISSSIRYLSLHENRLRTGIKSMVPFLQHARNLDTLILDDNNIQSEEFNFLLVALCDSPISRLFCRNCDIESIQIDNEYHSSANLEVLNLCGNRINEDGCRGLARLLQMPDCALNSLDLSNNDVNDAGVEILVDALQKNNSLMHLNLRNNHEITKDGKIMMLKLIFDISTIESTLQSNHTLMEICLGNNCDENVDLDPTIVPHVRDVLSLNEECEGNAETAGQEKLIQFQLHSGRRSVLAELQNVHQSVYSEISSLHLPEVLSLVGYWHGQGELYTALKLTIAELMSTVNRKRRIKEEIDHHLAKVAQLTAELAAIEAEEEDGTSVVSYESHENKRRRKG